MLTSIRYGVVSIRIYVFYVVQQYVLNTSWWCHDIIINIPEGLEESTRLAGVDLPALTNTGGETDGARVVRSCSIYVSMYVSSEREDAPTWKIRSVLIKIGRNFPRGVTRGTRSTVLRGVKKWNFYFYTFPLVRPRGKEWYFNVLIGGCGFWDTFVVVRLTLTTNRKEMKTFCGGYGNDVLKIWFWILGDREQGGLGKLHAAREKRVKYYLLIEAFRMTGKKVIACDWPRCRPKKTHVTTR